MPRLIHNMVQCRMRVVNGVCSVCGARCMRVFCVCHVGVMCEFCGVCARYVLCVVDVCVVCVRCVVC